MRGEHAEVTSETFTIWGSSPHARGAQSCQTRRVCAQGIIPACAGSTSCQSRSGWPCWDHPRMRGEHKTWHIPRLSPSGSSPHARGARLLRCKAFYPRRIIPACAGSTARIPRRVGGGLGSSPHARGAQLRWLPSSMVNGIIPACAGSTRRAVSYHLLQRDHPRMRGEHIRKVYTMDFEKGSSPHARGARVMSSSGAEPSRIIPACAGSTRTCGRRPRPTWDHPRMRGEHAVLFAMAAVALGSSPHARGAHVQTKLD